MTEQQDRQADQDQLRSDIKLAEAMAELVETVWWRQYEAAVTLLGQRLGEEVLRRPTTGLEMAFDDTYKKGTIAGLSQAITVPRTMAEQLGNLRAAMAATVLEKETDDETSGL